MSSATWRVEITGNDIETYIESGINLTQDGTYNFVVTKLPDSGEPYDINGITFVTIPAGTFRMGDVEGNGYDREIPVHTVTLSSFEMSIYEVTNAQYAEYLNKALTTGEIEIITGDVYGKTGDWSGQRYLDIGYGSGENKCWINYSSGSFTAESGKENRPVVGVTWYGSKAFAEYYGFDLPREAEWEYACRGGNQYKYGTL
ncbi:Hercynine oxygenase [subsurface metagenome]